MRLNHLPLFFAVFVIVSGLKATAQDFYLNGSISGRHKGYVVLQYTDINGKKQTKVSPVKGQTFSIHGVIARADFAYLDTDTTYYLTDGTYNGSIHLVPGHLQMSFSFGKTVDAKITGSSFQAEADAWRLVQKQELEGVKRYSRSADSVRVLLKTARISSADAEVELQRLNQIASPFRKRSLEKDISYVRTHPASYLSIKLLKNLIGRIAADSIDLLYAGIAEKVKNSSIGYDFSATYSKYKNAVGKAYAFDKINLNTPAPAFEISGIAAERKSALKKDQKVTVLEFWELTCLPCLQANPELETLRKKFGGKVDIVGITSTAPNKISQLRAYIDKNRLEAWTHVVQGASIAAGDQLVQYGSFAAYEGLGVPRTVVIGASGLVVFKKWGYSKEDMQLLQDVLEKELSNE